MRFLFSSIIALLILVSCGGGTTISMDQELQHAVAPTELSARMTLKVLSEQNGEKRMRIVIENPARVPIQSVRAWLAFDPSLATVRNLVIEDQRFFLFAPDEKNIDTSLGFVKIGAAVREPIIDPVVTLASMDVSPRRSDVPPVFTFHDWREEGDGHSAVLSFENGKLHNILSAPPSIEPW